MTYEPLAETLKDLNLNSAQISKLREMLKAEYVRGGVDELESFFKGLDVWTNPDGTKPTLDVPVKRIKDRIKELKETNDDTI